MILKRLNNVLFAALSEINFDDIEKLSDLGREKIKETLYPAFAKIILEFARGGGSKASESIKEAAKSIVQIYGNGLDGPFILPQNLCLGLEWAVEKYESQNNPQAKDLRNELDSWELRIVQDCEKNFQHSTFLKFFCEGWIIAISEGRAQTTCPVCWGLYKVDEQNVPHPHIPGLLNFNPDNINEHKITCFNSFETLMAERVAGVCEADVLCDMRAERHNTALAEQAAKTAENGNEKKFKIAML